MNTDVLGSVPIICLPVLVFAYVGGIDGFVHTEVFGIIPYVWRRLASSCWMAMAWFASRSFSVDGSGSACAPDPCA